MLETFREALSHVLKGHSAPVKSISYNCDGSLLISASDDKTVKVNFIVLKLPYRYGQLLKRNSTLLLKDILIGSEKLSFLTIQE